MRFKTHSEFEGRHAFLSASKHAWINYTDERFVDYFKNVNAAARGTRLHQLAHDLIREGVQLKSNGSTLSKYVNDAIGFRMKPEQLLYYSEFAFGTADAISFRKGKLRIHDLKTGTGVTSENQLVVYAAFFCLEYNMSPFDIEIELRIYQNDEVRIYDVDPDDIMHIMESIKRFDKMIRQMMREEEM